MVRIPKRVLLISLLLSGISTLGQTRFGDLDGDNQADLLFRSDAGGFACSFNSNSNEFLTNGLVSGFQKDTAWHVAALTDLDGDSIADLLFRHPEGMWEFVPMEGCSPREEERALVISLPDRYWRIALTVDIDDDHRDELFLRDENGQWGIWYVEGADVQKRVHDPEGFPVGNDWRAVGSGYVDSDDLVDIVIRHRDGAWTRVWPTNDLIDTFSSESLPFETDPDWREEAIADFDGDGRADLLLRHALGRWKVQSLGSNEGSELVEWDVKTLPVSWDWRIEALGDIKGDGRDHVLLRGPENRWDVSPVSSSTTESESIQIGTDPNNSWAVPSPPIYLPDTLLKRLIELELSVSDDAWIFRKDMLQVRQLSSMSDNNHLELDKISDLRGLRYAYHLQELRLSNQEIDNLAPLIGLERLNSIILDFNQIQDISSLTGLTNVSRLSLNNNLINIVSPLKNLTQLTKLDLTRNRIVRINGLQSLTSLSELRLSNNQISDLSPLRTLTELGTLYLDWNDINTIDALSGLEKLKGLHLSGNKLSDLTPLRNLVQLTLLSVRWNTVQDLSGIERLTNLVHLYLTSNRISDISPLEDLVKLRILNLGANEIEDIRVIGGLPELTHVYLFSNKISDIESLSKLQALVYVDLRFNLLGEPVINNLESLRTSGTDVRATIVGTFTDSRSTSATYGYDFRGSTSETSGVLVRFHGNNYGTPIDMINTFLPSTSVLANQHGLVGVVVSSPEGNSANLPWSSPYNEGDGVRFYNYVEDVDLLHEMLQSGFDGSLNVDLSQVYLHGGSQGTCFLNRFVSKWGKNYSGGLLADCGCSEGLDPLVYMDPTNDKRFRIFVRATTGDFLHNLSRQAYGYYKYVVGFDTKGDLSKDGRHCSNSAFSDDEALTWLREGDSRNEAMEEAHVTRISLFDRIVGLATDSKGSLWIVQQVSGHEPQATLWRSVDRGATFEFVQVLPYEIYDLDIVDERLFLTTTEGPLLRSDDFGSTFLPIDLSWTIANGLITLPFNNEIVGRSRVWRNTALSSTRDGTLLLLPKDQNESLIYVSKDFGESWSEKNAPQPLLRVLQPDPINLGDDEWYATFGRPPAWMAVDDGLSWQPVNRPTEDAQSYSLRTTAWTGTELLGFTNGYGHLWSSIDLGNRWQRKTLPRSAEISFGYVSSADLTAVTNGDVLLVGGGRDAQLYNGQSEEWVHIYGAAGIGLTQGYIHLAHQVAVDPIRGDIFITDSRGLFRIDARFRPDEVGVPTFSDQDQDSIPDLIDKYPEDPLEYLDTDSDGVGNTRDKDDDGDGTEDVLDASPLDRSETLDLDGDGVGDRHDNDKDGDRVVDVLDHFPSDFNESMDTDNDGLGNWEDLDDDNDGIEDRVDAFPLYANETADSDGDFIGDNIDPHPFESTFDSTNHLSPAIGSWAGKSAVTISMNLTKPSGLNAPEFVSGKSLFGTLSLGSAGVTNRHLMLVMLEGTEMPILYMDRNGDNDLTNDGPALHFVRGENLLRERWYRSWVEVSYTSGETLPYYLYVTFRWNENGDSADLSIGASGRVLSMALPDNVVMNFVAIDRNGDGLFNGSDDIYCVDLNLDGRFTNCNPSDEETSDTEQFQTGESFTLRDVTYLPQISQSGYTIEFDKTDNSDSSASSYVFDKGVNGRPTGHSSTSELREISEDSFVDPVNQIEY